MVYMAEKLRSWGSHNLRGDIAPLGVTRSLGFHARCLN